MSTRVEESTTGAAIVEDEERLHARVQARIALGTGGSVAPTGGHGDATAADLDRELIELRDLMAEARAEDLPPLVEQMTRLSAIRARLGGSKTLPVDVRSPYFAHMVIRERGKSRDVLIGKRGFIDREAGVQIVDWRNAPISQVYYRYEEGDDFDEEVGDRRFEGIIEVRRNISIHDAKLRRIGAPQGTFVRSQDGVWHQAVGELKPTLQGGVGTAVRVPKAQRNEGKRRDSRARQGGRLGVHHGEIQRADKHLPEIAALIDHEQFDLISQPTSGMVVIQGGAGSGKTTVALHRVAFLAFADKERFRPHRMLFVVPTTSLVRYVEGVLPSLGVRGVPVVTYTGWARKLRQKLLRGSGGKYNEDTPDAVARIKKHPALLPILEDFVAEKTARIGAEIAALDESGRLAAEWKRLGDEPLIPRLRKLYVWAKERRELSVEERNRFQAVLLRTGKTSDDILADWAELMTDRARLQAGFEQYAESSVPASEIERCVSWCGEQNAEGLGYVDDEGRPIETVDGRSLDEEGAEGRFDEEDDAILLRLIQLQRGGLMARDVKEIWYEHVAIDEAQDRSALEVKVLLDATVAEDDDPMKRSVTIAGDTAQRLIFDNHFADWPDLLRHIGYAEEAAAELVKPLHLSYRSTAEVMQLAREILGPELAPREDLMARSGAPVELHGFGDAGEAVAFLSDALRALMNREPTASVAVIARYSEQADLYYAGLTRAEVPALRRVRNHEFDFVPGIDVTDVSQVKGLEFDYVVMVEVGEVSYPDTVEARHLLHIGATRAAHQLWLVATGPASKLLPPRLTQDGLFALG